MFITLVRSLLLLVYFGAGTDTRELQVLNSGMMKLDKDDMAVMFFVSVKNVGDCPLRAMATTIECCERISDDDTDCDLMDLYGGDFGLVEPGAETNFTLVYPNLYGYNRKGNCLVNVIYRRPTASESEEIHHKIDFDTSVSAEEVPLVLKGWYDPKTFVGCDTPDLDPFDNCNPVNCQLKYSGNRNYFSRKWKMCRRAPACKADAKKEFPDVAYVPTSNTCRDLDKAVTKKDIDHLASLEPDEKQSAQKMVNIRCHHGEINPKTGLCICDPGWKSAVFDPDSYDGSVVYSMCNIKCPGEDPYKLLPFMLGVVLALWLFFCVICCEKLNCFCPGKRTDEEESEEPACSLPMADPKSHPASNCTAAMMALKKNSLGGDFTTAPFTPKISQKTVDSTKSYRSFSETRTSLFSAKYS